MAVIAIRNESVHEVRQVVDASDAWVMDPTIAPAATGFACNDGQARPSELASFAVSFTQDVSASLSVQDLIVTNESDSDIISQEDIIEPG
jgi:hypothetical protein